MWRCWWGRWTRRGSGSVPDGRGDHIKRGLSTGRKTHRRSLESYAVTNGGLQRVNNLLAAYDREVKALSAKRRAASADILRAAVVLLHAILEEFVRHVAGCELPLAGEQALNDVPLAGSERTDKKFALGALAAHRGKQVDAVLAESVRRHLAETSFSTLPRIMATLKSSGFATNRLRIKRAALARLIDRRHQIVHEGDVPRGRALSNHTPRALARRQVTLWLDAVSGLINEVDRLWTRLKSRNRFGSAD